MSMVTESTVYLQSCVCSMKSTKSQDVTPDSAVNYSHLRLLNIKALAILIGKWKQHGRNMKNEKKPA